jgi:catechol-2,3-dioxygenase
MSAVIRLGYVHLRVTDLEEARNHYSNTLGMEVVASEWAAPRFSDSYYSCYQATCRWFW